MAELDADLAFAPSLAETADALSPPSGRLRPLRLPLLFIVTAGAVLAADALTASFEMQVLLGALTFVALLAGTHGAAAQQRRLVWTCVAVGTVVELFGSILWGVYRYRLGNVPLYVPPGHGIVYLCGIRLAATPPFQARPQLVRNVALVSAGAWALAGLTVLPLITHRLDVLGAFWFVYFAMFLLRTRRGGFFAAIFLLTSLLELAGTGLGDWTWQASAPGIHVSVGNPPSVIAGAYCVLDAVVILVGRLVGRIARHRLQAAPAVADAA